MNLPRFHPPRTPWKTSPEPSLLLPGLTLLVGGPCRELCNWVPRGGTNLKTDS